MYRPLKFEDRMLLVGWPGGVIVKALASYRLRVQLGAILL